MRSAGVWRGVALVVIMAAFAALVYAQTHDNPVMDRHTVLPSHMDEWVHWGFAQGIVREGTVGAGDPFSDDPGAAPLGFGESVHEQGFQAYLGLVQATTGIPWLTLLAAWPAAVAALLALALYAVAEPWGAGLEAATFAIAIPTTVRFLGPAFVVPIALALLLVAAGMRILFHEERAGAAVAVGILVAALWLIHAMGAVALSLLAVVFALVHLRASLMRRLALAAAIAAPFVAFLPTILDAADERSHQPWLSPNVDVLYVFGVATMGLAALGAAMLVASADRSRRAAGVALAAGLAGAEGVLLARNAFGVDVFWLYDRAVLVAFLFACVLAAVCVAGVRRAVVARLPRRALAGAAAAALLLVPVASAAWSANEQLHQDVYQIVTDDQFESFREASESFSGADRRALVDGVASMPFALATGRPVEYVVSPADTRGFPRDLEEFFGRGASDTYLLMTREVQIVVTDRPVSNPDLVSVAPSVYVLRLGAP